MRERKILIGCGEASVTEALKILLRKDGMAVVDIVTTCFDEFVREASAGDFDLMILYGNSMTPPFLCAGGLLENTLFAVRAVKTSRPVPLIALTSMDEWLEPLRSAGADVCLKTPFDAEELRVVDPPYRPA